METERLFQKLSPLTVWVRLFGLMLGAVCIALVVKENYPFSHNPMYSELNPKTYFLYVTDEKDEILLFREQFGFSAIRLKKVFNTKFQKAKKEAKKEGIKMSDEYKKVLWRVAGEGTLWQYHRQREPRVEDPVKYSQLKLIRTDIELVPGKVAETVEVIAEIDVTSEASGTEP